MQGSASQWRYVVFCGIAVWAAGAGEVAFAQAPPPCESLLTTAEERYVQREFAEAESLARACLVQPELDDAEALRAYRLLTLVFLRQDDLPEAKQAVLQLLGVSFEYVPDPIRDPPAYVALVTSIKEQLEVERALAPTDSARAMPPVAQTEDTEPESDVQIVQTDLDSSEEPPPIVEAEPARKRRGLVKWLLIGGGVVAASVAAVMLTSSGSSATPPGGDSFPPPPAFPR